jgi:hypothetical protein
VHCGFETQLEVRDSETSESSDLDPTLLNATLSRSLPDPRISESVECRRLRFMPRRH